MPTPDVDGLASSYIMYDYLKSKLGYDKVRLFWNERGVGHGIDLAVDRVPDATDLLIIIDSSTSDVNACMKLNEDMDILIIDHHLPEKDNPYALIVNPQLHDYPNKDSSATLLTYKFVELMDYKYKKNGKYDYIDVTGMSLLSDQMDMTVMENRYFVSQALENVTNIGLLALIEATRNGGKDLDSQIFNYDIIPNLNTIARNDELSKGFQLLLEKDFFKAKRMATALNQANKDRKELVKKLVDEYMEVIQDEKFAYVVTKNSSKGYNGLVASKVADTLKKPTLILKDNGDTYSGSGRTYNGFDMKSFVQESNLIEYAAGHAEAFGFSIKAENWNDFKQYVNDNIDDDLFEQVIEYDIELSENQLDWDLMDEIEEWNRLWGNNNSPVKVRLNDVFVEDREVFPPKSPSHVKIKADSIDLLRFNEPEYASDTESWDSISAIGSVGVNEWNKNKQMQLFIEDYIKN